MSESQRNLVILIVIAIAAAMFSGVGGPGLAGINMLLGVAFTVLIIWFLVNLYQRNSGTIASMPNTPRMVLQASAASLLIIVVTGMLRFPFLPRPFGWSGYGGSYTLFFWGSVFGFGFAIWWAWQQRTSKW